ncbi:hypothetical protein Dimus_031820 [Dionaea muscipula]
MITWMESTSTDTIDRVLWKHPEDKSSPVVFRLSHGGDVEADGNCLLTASQRAMEVPRLDSRELRRRMVRRFLKDLGFATVEEELVELVIRHIYSLDLKFRRGILVVQDVKLLARKADRHSLDSSIDEIVNLGMQR